MGKLETKEDKQNTRKRKGKIRNKKPLCTKSASKRWTTNSHCQIYTRLTLSANIHLGARRTCYWQNRVINVQQSAAQEVNPVPCGCWYLEGREQKLGETLNALLFWVHHGAKGPSMLVVPALAPSEREGFYTSSVAA